MRGISQKLMRVAMLLLSACAQNESEIAPSALDEGAVSADAQSIGDSRIRDAWPMMAVDVASSSDSTSADALLSEDQGPQPDARVSFGYCPEIRMSDGWDSDGRDSDRIGYFGDGGADPNGCNVGYPGADECFACMIERCCLLMGGLDQVAASRYTARGGDDLFRGWSAYSIPRSEEADAWHWVGRYANNGLVACARHCVASALAASIDTSTAVDRCLDDCTEVFVPDCQRTAEEILVVEVFRSASMQFYACMLSGPEANATLGSPPDYPYPSYAQDHSRPRDMPYEARYAETSCARVCFGVEP
jgi:hypothetical protein